MYKCKIFINNKIYIYIFENCDICTNKIICVKLYNEWVDCINSKAKYRYYI